MKINNPTITKANELKPDDQFPVGRPGDDRAIVVTYGALFELFKAALNLTRLDGFSATEGGAGTFTGKPIVTIDTAIVGTDGLAAVKTAGVPVGETAKFFIDGDGTLNAWQLIAGTNRHKPDEGICRPADYDSTNNKKVWRRVL